MAALMCAVLLYIWDNKVPVLTDQEGREILERGTYGEEVVRKMKVRIGEEGQEKEIDIPVSGKEYTREEIRQVFSQADQELERQILGENESLDEIRYDMDLITELSDLGVSITWELDRYDVMDIQGNLREEALTEKGAELRLTATLACGEEQQTKEFCAKIFPPLKDKEQEIMEEIREQISLSDEKTRTGDYLVLPDSVDGQKLEWKYGTDTRAAAILVLGLGAAAMLIVSERQRKKEEEKASTRQMKIDYPQIINRFNLYIRAGMTIRRAWFCIARDYENKKEYEEARTKKKAYEEMVFAMYQISSGAPEGECYENYGTRCGISAYRKFGSMLSQNLRKGTKGLTDFLGREAEDAFEERKNLAKKMGEEAGTKLMIPMFMMLIIVFIMVIVPAFFSIRV